MSQTGLDFLPIAQGSLHLLVTTHPGCQLPLQPGCHLPCQRVECENARDFPLGLLRICLLVRGLLCSGYPTEKDERQRSVHCRPLRADFSCPGLFHMSAPAMLPSLPRSSSSGYISLNYILARPSLSDCIQTVLPEAAASPSRNYERRDSPLRSPYCSRSWISPRPSSRYHSPSYEEDSRSSE